jgi:hypothetical protein
VPWRAWVWLVGGLLVYATLVSTLLVLDLGTTAPADPLLPAWAPLLLTPVLYGVLAAAALARASLLAALVATGVLCGARIALGFFSAMMDTTISLTPFSEAFVNAFSGVSLLTLLGLAGPPLLLHPFGRVRSRRRWARYEARHAAARARNGETGRGAMDLVVPPRTDRRAPVPAGGGSWNRSAAGEHSAIVIPSVPPPPVVPPPPAARPPSTPPAPPRSLPENRPPAPAVRTPVVEPRPARPASQPAPVLASAPPLVPAPTPPPPPPAVAAALAPVPSSVAPVAPPPRPAPPAEVRAKPAPSSPAPVVSAPPPPPLPSPDSARLEPGEKTVRVPLLRLVDQLPSEVFRVDREQLTTTLGQTGHLLVPLRLVAPQLSEGLVQVPWSTIAGQFPRQVLALSDADIARRLPSGMVVLPLDEIVRQMPSSLFAMSGPTIDVRGLEDFPPPFQPHVPPSSGEIVEPSPMPTSPAASTRPPAVPAPQRPSVTKPPAPGAIPKAPPAPSAPRLAPVVGGTKSAPEPAARPAEAATPSSSAEDDTIVRRLGTLMRGLRAPLEVAVHEAHGVKVFTVVPAGVSDAVVAATAARVVPCLATPLPEPLAQLTLRSADTVLVLTPLGGRPPCDALIAAALPVGAPLAMLEQQTLRAASSLARRAPAGGTLSLPPAPRIDLHDAAVPAHLRTVAESLRAFGPLSPALLRDGAGARVVYLFLPRGMEARGLGALASQLQASLADAEIGPLTGIVLRLAGVRVVVRALDGDSGSLLVAGGSGERPGLARLEVERAARRLTARGA